MEFERFLDDTDSSRAARTIAMLSGHNSSRLALTGGLAIELHVLRRMGEPGMRRLHDIDFVTSCFDDIPESMGDALLVRHVHPHDPPGKTIFQGVHPATGVRIDVFRAYGSEMLRAAPIETATVPFKVISVLDLVARHARLCWDLEEGKGVAPKYARDFLRMLELVETDEVESVWHEHRKPGSPATFTETASHVCQLIASRSDLLVPPTYSTDVQEVCPRCRECATFRLADAATILSILGYC